MENQNSGQKDWYDKFKEIEEKFEVYKKNKSFVETPLVIIRTALVSSDIDFKNRNKDLSDEELSDLRRKEFKKKSLVSFFETDYKKMIEEEGVSAWEESVKEKYSTWPNFSVDSWIPKRKSLMEKVSENLEVINHYLANAPREHVTVLQYRLGTFKKEYGRFLDF